MRFWLYLELVVIGILLHVALLLLQATNEKYWPDVGEEAQYSTVRVASKSETALGNFVVRKLVLSSEVPKASIVRFASINLPCFFCCPINLPSLHSKDVNYFIFFVDSKTTCQLLTSRQKQKNKKKTVRNKMHDQFALIFFEWDYAMYNDENNNMLYKWNQFYGNSLDWSLGCNVLVSFLKNSCNKNVASL